MINFKKSIIYLILIGLASNFYSCEPNRSAYEMKVFYAKEYKAFKNSIVKALGLTFVLKNETYNYSRLRIYNDTIVAFTSAKYNYATQKLDNCCIYSIQSIKKPQNMVEFGHADVCIGGTSNIDQYRNGCLYFGKFGGSTVQSLCADSKLSGYTDGKLTEYFKAYNDTLFYANKVMLYEDLAVVNSMNGIYIFNIKSQKLLWKNQKLLGFLYVHFSIIGNKLFMLTGADVTCMNLDNLKIEWFRKINCSFYGGGYNDKFRIRDHIPNDGNNLVIPTDSACYLLDLKTGEIRYKTPWKDIVSKESQYQTFYVQNKKLYTSNPNNKNTLLCIDMVTNKLQWQIPNLYFLGIYKNHLVANTKDQELFIVINKTTGKIEHKIPNPNTRLSNFGFVDKYVLINSTSLYK